jgi:hypothetical protein
MLKFIPTVTLLTLSQIAFAQAPAAPAAAPAKPARVVPPARIIDFRVTQNGGASTLVWATENPNNVTITPEPGRVTPRGSMTVAPATNTVYTLTVTGPNNQTETRQVTVNATAASGRTAAANVQRPNLNGVFGAAGGGIGGGRGGAPAVAGPEVKPGKESFRVVRGAGDAGALADCMPIAGPAAYTVPYQFQIVQNENYVLILHEYPGIFRIVPIGAEHPVDPDPTWLGDAIGRWDGDTLVVDTIGFNTRTELSGYKHSEALHIVERFRRPTPEVLEYSATLEDPEVFVRPWTVTRNFGLRSDLKKIDEFVCENNKNYSDLFAK